MHKNNAADILKVDQMESYAIVLERTAVVIASSARLLLIEPPRILIYVIPFLIHVPKGYVRASFNSV